MFKKRNSLYFFIIFLITTIFILQYLQIREDQKKQIIQSLKNQSLKLDAWLLKKKNFLEKLSKDLGNMDYDKETYLDLMKETNKKMGTNSIFSGFKNGEYIDTQGYWIDNFDPRKRPWYIETLQNKETTFSGPMYYNDISGQRIVWWAISSVLSKDNKPFGVVSSEILPDMIIEHLKDIQLDDLEHIFLFHKKTGIIISAINRDIELKHVQDIYSMKIFEDFLKTKETKIKFKYKNQSKTAYTFHLTEAPWILCIIK